MERLCNELPRIIREAQHTSIEEIGREQEPMELQFCEDKETGIYDCPPVFDEEPEEGDFLFIMTLKG